MRWFFWGLFWVVVIGDQLSKLFAQKMGISSINKGISFSLFSQNPLPVLLVSTGVLALLFGWWWRQQPTTWSELGWAGVLGGGASNLIDRWGWAGVRDWLVLPGMPWRNNFADIAITIGVLVLVSEMVWQRSRKVLV